MDRSVRAVVVCVVFGLCVAFAGCKRPCESADNCKRTCQCVNGATQARLACTMAFRCDGADQVCEPDYDNLSCDDVCNQYAKNAECGFERCAEDAECTKNLTCPIKDADGNPTALNYDCTLTFACDQDAQLCAAASTVPVDQMCVTCDQQRAAQGG